MLFAQFDLPNTFALLRSPADGREPGGHLR